MEAIPDQGPRAEGHGSRTITVTSTPDREAGPSTASPTESSREGTPSAVGVLRLRGGPARSQRVVWSAETIDNEGMGKKKSKICCIYHKPRRFDESSSESDSCSDDDDHSCSGEGSHSHGGSAQRARPSGGGAEIEEESSESDGGAGDGRARPARRPRKKHHSHQPKANKYDSKGKGKESPSHDSPENARS